MSYQERIVQLAADIPDNYAAVAFFLLKQYLEAAEAADDAFCIALDDAFVDNPDKGELVDFEDACKQLGIEP